MPALEKFSALAAASMLFVSASCASQTAQSQPEEIITYKTTELFTQGPYRFASEQLFSQSPGEPAPLGMEETLIVFKDGQEIHREEGWRWEVYNSPAAPTVGSDITGDGIPDVILIEDTGGSHAPWTFYIFELRDGLPVHTFAPMVNFKQLDETPALELSVRDDNFEDWKAPAFQSAFPDVAMRYRNGAYELAPDLMRAPPPSPAEFDELVQNSRSGDGWKMTTAPRNGEFAWDIGYQFLSEVIDLIYNGHADLVPKFANDAWPPAKPGKQEFIQELMECRIRMSSYWPAIAALNNLPPDPPIGRCLRGTNEG